MLDRAGVRVVDAFKRLDRAEVCPLSSTVSSKNEYDLAGIAPGAPEPIALMITDGFRKAILGTKEIDRGSLAVVIAEDRCILFVPFRLCIED
jgi:hypothetical protein